MSLLWFENFDSYTAGSATIPAPWTGPGNTIISNSVFHSSPNGFGAGAAGNGSGTTRPLIALATHVPVWSVDFWVRIPTGSGLATPGSAGLYMIDSVGGGQIQFVVGSDGGCNIHIPFGATLFSTFTLSLDTWHHLLWSTTQSATGSSNLTIDGVAQTPFSGDTRGSGNAAYSDALELVGQTIGGSPPAEVFFDDITTYNSLPPFAVGGPMSSIIT
jgi:hypothetical protein